MGRHAQDVAALFRAERHRLVDALYPPDNFKRPTGPLCDGCHSVELRHRDQERSANGMSAARNATGRAARMSRSRAASNILNPARFDYVHANDICIQCHSQGRPLKNPIEGKYYDWPVGFHVGLNLADFWELEEHKLGETSFTHFPDGTAHKNRMQGNDFVQSLMYARGVTCFNCHDPHGTENQAMLREPGNALCLDLPRTEVARMDRMRATIEQHTHHAAGSAGSACVACHMPKIAETLGDVNVRSHTFRFVWPAQTDTLKDSERVQSLSHGQDDGVGDAALRSWNDRSPWRSQ